ncbi:MAG: MarR family EPS-associated transcriptional regulator [Candidatus Omnitrophota bacterium]|nr:MarR family EPS-associated transcriptional regulator [Candidatus Omnitrophota bacterium]
MREQTAILNSNLSKSEQEETLSLLSELHGSSHLTQRDLALKLNVSLGKTNYLIKQLMTKGLIKARNFSNNPGKFKKVKYILTQEGFKEKFRLTYYFLKRKESEYRRIKEEWEQLKFLVNTVGNDDVAGIDSGEFNKI